MKSEFARPYFPRNPMIPSQRFIGTQAICGKLRGKGCVMLAPNAGGSQTCGPRQAGRCIKPSCSSGTPNVIRTKSVYSLIDRRNDGLRVLVTRFRGRGLPKNRVRRLGAESRPQREVVARQQVRACRLDGILSALSRRVVRGRLDRQA